MRGNVELYLKGLDSEGFSVHRLTFADSGETFTVKAVPNPHMFDDGVPVAKYFDRGSAKIVSIPEHSKIDGVLYFGAATGIQIFDFTIGPSFSAWYSARGNSAVDMITKLRSHNRKVAGMNITASDRESLIKLASSLPKGDLTRKAILAGLKTAGIPDQEARPASADALIKATSHIPGRNVKDHGDLGANVVYAVEGESNTKVGAALIKLLTANGFTNVVKGKFMGSSEIGFSANYREGGRIFATLLSRTRGGRVTTYVSVEARNTVGRSAASNEPMARALERMNDALDRGGIDSMIKATAARLKATKDPSKTLGIAMAIKQFLAQYSSTLSISQEKELLWLQNSAEGTGTLGGGVVATRTEVPGPGASVVKDAYTYQHSILPAGYVDVATGANQYWDLDDTTAEVWKDGDNKLFAVVTYGHKPLCGIGSFCSFKHDQTGRPLRLGARMVGWFNLDPAGKFGGDIPKSGKLPVSTYK